MKEMWKFKLEKRKIDNITFGGNHIALSSGNELICFNSKGIAWSQKMHVTFYKDPYSDVSITTLDADQSHVVAGTNFMDGKVYLFTINGKLQWKHQFATIASLGWRPEDVTVVKVKDQFVVVGTEFMNEYIHVYTVNRKRVFQRRVKGRVEDFSFVGERLIAGTDSHLYVFSMDGKEECSVETPTKKVEVVNGKIIVLNNYGVVVYRKYGNGNKFKIKKYWSAKLRDPISCIVGENILLASENLLNYISKSGEVLWQKVLERPIVSLFYDSFSDEIYVGMENSIQILLNTGELIGDFKFNGKPLKIGRLEDVVVITYSNGDIGLYKIQ